MKDVLERLSEQFTLDWQGFINLLDVLLVTFLVYRLIKLVRGGRAWRLMLGILFFVAALLVSDFLGFQTLHWLLDKLTLLAPVALAIIFLPELRQAIEGFGRLGHWSERLIGQEPAMGANALEEVVAAASEMADQRTGALVVIERSHPLDDLAANGVPMNAIVTASLLSAIFNEGSPLHDGAVIIRRDRVLAAACRLPLSESPSIASLYHMRHRAGLGISEQSDCVVLIVSEERGVLTIAEEGRLIPMKGVKELREHLTSRLRAAPVDGRKANPAAEKPKKARKAETERVG